MLFCWILVKELFNITGFFNLVTRSFSFFDVLASLSLLVLFFPGENGSGLKSPGFVSTKALSSLLMLSSLSKNWENAIVKALKGNNNYTYNKNLKCSKTFVRSVINNREKHWNTRRYLPPVAITIASSSLPPLLTVMTSLAFGAVSEKSFSVSFNRSFFVSITHVLLSTEKYTRHSFGTLVRLRKAMNVW